jgi:hypothetical protein
MEGSGCVAIVLGECGRWGIKQLNIGSLLSGLLWEWLLGSSGAGLGIKDDGIKKDKNRMDLGMPGLLLIETRLAQ